MTPDTQSCATCKFAQRPPAAMQIINCRRYPPQVVPGPQGPLVIFPQMQPIGWCGEYQTKLELTS